MIEATLIKRKKMSNSEYLRFCDKKRSVKSAPMDRRQFLCVINRLKETIGVRVAEDGDGIFVQYNNTMYEVRPYKNGGYNYSEIIGSILRAYSNNKQGITHVPLRRVIKPKTIQS